MLADAEPEFESDWPPLPHLPRGGEHSGSGGRSRRSSRGRISTPARLGQDAVPVGRLAGLAGVLDVLDLVGREVPARA